MGKKEPSHVIVFRSEKLKPQETVQAFLTGWIGNMMGTGKDKQHNGVLIVTNQRLAFFRRGFFGEVLETIPLSKMTSVEHSSFMGHRVLTVHTSHDELRFKTLDSSDDFKRLYDILEAFRDTSAVSRVADAQHSPSTPLDKLKQLADLRKAGIITEEDFHRKKQELLDQV